MDPVTAFQTAAAVIGLVDVAARVLSDSHEIYRSGQSQTARNASLSQLSTELGTLSAEVHAHVNGSQPDTLLVRIAKRCTDASKRLQDAVDALRSDTASQNKLINAAKSLVTALKGIWKQKDIDELRADLSDIRSQMILAVLVSISQSKNDLVDGQKSLQDRLDLITSNLDDQSQAMHKFAQELIRLSDHSSSARSIRQQGSFIDILLRLDWNSWTAQHGENFFNLPAVSEVPLFGKLPVTTVILDSLYVRELDARQQSVSEAYSSTFKWIFSDDYLDVRGYQLDWPSFPKWLHEPNDLLYWITGKIGSGKSTLMKYIFTNQGRLRHDLADYAGDLPLLLAAFFIWSPGAPLQRTREGLLRSLLHQALTQHHEIIPEIMPKRWAIYNLFEDGENLALPNWTEEELSEAFELLCSKQGKSFQFALFIDGLDEFEQADVKPSPIVEWVKTLVKKHKIKMCVSSREWNVFSDAFHTYKHIAMQDLTRLDITKFVESKFEENTAFRDLQSVYPAETASLLLDIVERADGVFLWVSLAVENLLTYTDDGATIPSIRQRLDETPKDLMALYTALWKSLPPERREGASKIMQLCCSPWVMEKRHFWLSYNCVDPTMDVRAAPLPGDGFEKVLRRTLRGHTRGICDLQNNSDLVEFHHRSAADWLKEPMIWAEIVKAGPTKFHPTLAYWIALQILLRQWELERHPSGATEFLQCVVCCMDDIVMSTPSPDVQEQANLFFDRTDALIDEEINFRRTPRRIDRDIQAPAVFRDNHWLSHPKIRSLVKRPTGGQDSIIGFAAGCGLFEYVVMKIANDNSLLEHHPRRISLLESAILYPPPTGFFDVLDAPELLYRDLPDYRAVRARDTWSVHGRLDIISYILEQQPDMEKFTSEGDCLYDEVVRRRRVAKDESVGRPAYLNYEPYAVEFYDIVLHLLKKHGYTSDAEAATGGLARDGALGHGVGQNDHPSARKAGTVEKVKSLSSRFKAKFRPKDTL